MMTIMKHWSRDKYEMIRIMIPPETMICFQQGVL